MHVITSPIVEEVYWCEHTSDKLAAMACCLSGGGKLCHGHIVYTDMPNQHHFDRIQC